MIQKGKELHNIKCYDTSMALLESPSPNEVSEVDASIGGRSLSDTAKLVWVQKTIVYHMELKSIANDFLDELSCSVE